MPGELLRGARIRPDFEAMLTVPGGRAYVRVNGDLGGPRPPIVLLHGGPGSSHWYFLNATALADDRAVILYDQLDSGRSEHPGIAANWNVPRFVDELEAIRAHLSVKRWHVLGASWGGTVALEYAAKRPTELAGLVLESPLVSTAVWLADARKLKDAMPETVRDLLDRCDVAGAAPKAECNSATEAFYARHVRMYAPPTDVAAYKAAMPRSFSDDIYNAMWGRAEFTATGTLKDYDGRALLAQLDARRTLFVAGQHDEAIPATVAGFARDVPGGAEFREIAGAAHSVMNDNPAGYVAVLRAWLAGRDAD
jgi:proline iminopeptidase/L-proline amide hydrolase